MPVRRWGLNQVVKRRPGAVSMLTSVEALTFSRPWLSSWSLLRFWWSGGWRKIEHARITAALVLRNSRPAASKVYKLIPDILVLGQSSKPRVFMCVSAGIRRRWPLVSAPLVRDHRQDGARAVPV